MGGLWRTDPSYHLSTPKGNNTRTAITSGSSHRDGVVEDEDKNMAKRTKNMTLRLPLESAQRLEFIATAEGTNMSALIRTMVDDYLEARRNDPNTREELLDSVRQVAAWLEDGGSDEPAAEGIADEQLTAERGVPRS